MVLYFCGSRAYFVGEPSLPGQRLTKPFFGLSLLSNNASLTQQYLPLQTRTSVCVRIAYLTFSSGAFCSHHSPALGSVQALPELYLQNKKETSRHTRTRAKQSGLAMNPWTTLEDSTVKQSIHTSCLGAALWNLPAVALHPWSYFHWQWLLRMDAVHRAGLDSLLYHGAFADRVNGREASTWKELQWLSAPQKAPSVIQALPTSTEQTSATVTQNLGCLSLRATFKWHVGKALLPEFSAHKSRALHQKNYPFIS